MSFSQNMQQINIDSEKIFQRFRLLKPNMSFRQRKGFIPGWIVHLFRCVKVLISQSLIKRRIIKQSIINELIKHQSSIMDQSINNQPSNQ